MSGYGRWVLFCFRYYYPGNQSLIIPMPEILMTKPQLLHFINKNALLPPWPEQMQHIDLAMGCFWGAERLFWQLTGVHVTMTVSQCCCSNDGPSRQNTFERYVMHFCPPRTAQIPFDCFLGQPIGIAVLDFGCGHAQFATKVLFFPHHQDG